MIHSLLIICYEYSLEWLEKDSSNNGLVWQSEKIMNDHVRYHSAPWYHPKTVPSSFVMVVAPSVEGPGEILGGQVWLCNKSPIRPLAMFAPPCTASPITRTCSRTSSRISLWSQRSRICWVQSVSKVRLEGSPMNHRTYQIDEFRLR